MSSDYSIDIVINALHNAEHLKLLLRHGIENGLEYHDHIPFERYHDAPILDSKGAAQKILKSLTEGSEEGPCIYTIIKQENTSSFLWFKKTEKGFIELRFAGFGVPRKKEFWIDFSYYIRIMLDMCKGFEIISIKTEMY